jgi:hypothetical protein
LFISLKLWNVQLNRYGLNDDNQRYMSNSLLNALRSYYYPIPDTDKCNIDFVESIKITDLERNELINRINNNKCENFMILKISDLHHKEKEYKAIFYDENMTTFDSIKFVVKEIVNNPELVAVSYYNNYLATINLHEYFIDNGVYYSNDIFKSIENENLSLAIHPLKSGNVYWWWYYLLDHTYEEFEQNYPYAEHMKQFEQDKEYSERVNNFIDFIYPVYSFIFKLLFLLSPFMMLWHLVKFIRFKTNKDMVLTTIFGTAFLYILFYSVTGAIIDRYAYTYYPLLLTVVLIEKYDKNQIVEKRSSKNEERNKKSKRKSIICNTSI